MIETENFASNKLSSEFGKVLTDEFGVIGGLAAGDFLAVKLLSWHMNSGMTRWKIEPLKQKALLDF